MITGVKLDRRTIAAAGAVIVSATAVILALAAVSAVAHNPPPGQEVPKITDWMQAWGSVGGVAAGLLAAAAAALLLMHERRKAAEAERQLAEERAEAALNAPRAVVTTPARFGTHGHNHEYINSIGTTVQNYGADPIRNVTVIVTLPDDGRRLVVAHYDLLPPGEAATVSVTLRSAPIEVAGPWMPRGGRAPVTVCFIDRNNQAWERTSDGDVSRTTVPYPLLDGSMPARG